MKYEDVQEATEDVCRAALGLKQAQDDLDEATERYQKVLDQFRDENYL